MYTLRHTWEDNINMGLANKHGNQPSGSMQGKKYLQ